MVSTEVKNKIKEDVRNYYKRSKRDELGGAKTPLYNKVADIERYYMKLYEEGYITRKDLDNGLADNVWDGVLDVIDSAVNGLYKGELEEGNLGKTAQEYEIEYKTELFSLVEDIFREGKDTIDEVLKGGIKEGSYEKEYVKLLSKLHRLVPEFVYVRYLTGDYLYYAQENMRVSGTEVIEAFVEDIEWIIKTRTNWIHERTADYYRYFQIIGQDPRRGSINRSDSRGLNMKDLNILVKYYVHKNKEINNRIKAVDKEIDYAYKIEKFNEDENIAFHVDPNELGKLYLGTLIVKNSMYKGNGKETRVMEQKIARILKEKGEVEGEMAMLKGLSSAKLSRLTTGVTVIPIKDTLFIVGNKGVVIVKGKEGQRQVVGRVATSNFSVKILKGYLR